MSEALDHFGVTPLAKIGLAEIEAFAGKGLSQGIGCDA